MKSLMLATAILLSGATLAVVPKAKSPAQHVSKSWKLAFTRDGNIWVANGDGTSQRLLIRNAEAPAWSPDKRQIAFARDGNVWVANADATNQRRLTSRWHKETWDYDHPNDHAMGRNVDISWDPQLDWLIFSHWEKFYAIRVGEKRGKIILCSSLYDAPLHSSKWRGHYSVTARYDLYDDDANFHFSNNSHPAFSKSGNRLAFARNGDIWVGVRRGMYPWGAAWMKANAAPDEWAWDVTRLAAVAYYDAPTMRGSRENEGVTHLSWAPDEKALAYGIERLGGSGFNEVHLLTIGPGKYHSPGVKRDRVLEDLGADPCFSPDGRFVAYEKLPIGYPNEWMGIMAISVDGKTKTRLVKNGWQPAW